MDGKLEEKRHIQPKNATYRVNNIINRVRILIRITTSGGDSEMKLRLRFLVPLIVLGLLVLSAVGVAFAREAGAFEFFQKHDQKEVEFTGVLESMNGSTWVVGGRTLTVPASAEIKGTLAVGQVIKVHATLADDGSLSLREAELASPDDTGTNMNGNDNSDQNDNEDANENDNEIEEDDANANDNQQWEDNNNSNDNQQWDDGNDNGENNEGQDNSGNNNDHSQDNHNHDNHSGNHDGGDHENNDNQGGGGDD
jgi:hypothetical protein